VAGDSARSARGYVTPQSGATRHAAKVARHLFNITCYLPGSGPRFNDGDTLDVSATEQFRAQNLPADGEQPPMLVLFMEAVQ